MIAIKMLAFASLLGEMVELWNRLLRNHLMLAMIARLIREDVICACFLLVYGI